MVVQFGMKSDAMDTYDDRQSPLMLSCSSSTVTRLEMANVGGNDAPFSRLISLLVRKLIDESCADV